MVLARAQPFPFPSACLIAVNGFVLATRFATILFSAIADEREMGYIHPGFGGTETFAETRSRR
jgi:hypothetical protein